MSFFTLNKVYNSVLYDFVLYDSAKTHAWDFFTYELKCCQLIRLQYSLIINISGKNQSVENFLYLYNLQRKVTSKITTWLVVANCTSCPIRLLDSWSSISLETINWYLSFLHGVSHEGFWLAVANCASHSIRLENSLIISISGSNRLTSYVFCMKIRSIVINFSSIVISC